MATVTYRRHGVDGSALLLAIAVHGLLLALLLLSRVALSPVPVERQLSVFDVALPPPPPPPVEPPPAPPPPPRRAAGGSPPPAAAPPLRMDSTVQPLAPSPPLVAPATSPFADALGLASLPGTSVGSGNGVGSGSGAGYGAGDGLAVYGRAEWIRKPTLTQMLPYWPTRARKRRIAGEVKLGCIVPKPGRPKRCWIVSEEPDKLGFGRAAVAMSHLFRIRPLRRNGQPLDVPIIVPVSYRVTLDTAAEATPDATPGDAITP